MPTAIKNRKSEISDRELDAPYPLSGSEEISYRRAEAKIKQGIKAFHEVGEALLKIRDARLYRGEYPTFEDYCEGKWGISRSKGYRLIEASEVVTNLKMSPIGNKLPLSESQTRPLSQLPAEEQGEAWAEVQKRAEESNKPITAAAVQAVVAERVESKPPPDPPREFTHRPIPANLLTLLNANSSLMQISESNNKIAKIKTPYQIDGKLYVTTGSMTHGSAGISEVYCYEAVRLEDWSGPLYTYQQKDLIATKYGSAYRSYHGIQVSRAGMSYVLKGPEITFVPREDASEAVIDVPPAKPATPKPARTVMPLTVEDPPAKEEEDILIPQQRLEEFVREMFVEFADALKVDEDGTFGERFVPLYDDLLPIPYWAKTIRKMAVRIWESEAESARSPHDWIGANEMHNAFHDALYGTDPIPSYQSHNLNYWARQIRTLRDRVDELEKEMEVGLVPSQSVANPTQSDSECPICHAPDFGKCPCDAEAVNAALRGETLPNPFLTRGGQAQHVDAESRLDAVKKFDLPQLRAALQVPKLQGTVRFAVEKRIKKLEAING